jgi:hypothetical protein
MVLSHEDDKAHPYWYAQIISIFHAIVQFCGMESHPTIEARVLQINFLGSDGLEEISPINLDGR